MKTLKSVLMLVLISGCNKNYIKPPDNPVLQTLPKIDPLPIRVHKVDEDRYTKYIKALRTKINFYEKQIEEFNKR
jgi:hypothetical protein